MSIFASQKLFAPSQLIIECEKMIELSVNFVEYAANEENARIEKQTIEEMEKLVDKLRVPISQYNGSQWNLSQSETIASCLKEIFKRLEKLTDKNEEDHVLKALKQIDTAKKCQNQMVDGLEYDNENWEIIIKNYNLMQGI